MQDRNHLLLPRIEPEYLGRPARYLVSILGHPGPCKLKSFSYCRPTYPTRGCNQLKECSNTTCPDTGNRISTTAQRPSVRLTVPQKQRAVGTKWQMKKKNST
jgi:hypothetical protein